ncbi:MAG TPA: ATP-binding cassette domain-containing protein [Cyclobacteriaceae bacterium]|nr:ATP-binding cassette domain-containing protein [Cyclobacteriaceae bacterium]
MIHINNVTVIKSGEKLFENLNLELEETNHYLITGPNGSGKTILLELIAGNIHAAAGEIQYDFIEGSNWEERYWDRKQKVQLIQTHAVEKLTHLTGETYYQQRYYSIENTITTRVKDVLGETIKDLDTQDFPPSMHIESLLEVEVNRLSNGQLKKVLLLQTLLKQKPKVLLLDYPFEGLDKISRQELSHFIDFIATKYSIQIILADHHHHLPAVINKRIDVNKFTIQQSEFVNHIPASVEINPPQQTSSKPVVEMRNLKIQYGDKVILENFNWTINEGERWALLGKNGSGKTTVFSLIFADHPIAYREEVYLFGKRRGTGESIWDIKKRITYLGPELISYLNPKNIAQSAIDYVRSLHPKGKEEKLIELLQYFNAFTFMQKPVKVLSSGQLQLMMVISSFLEDKELLLLDEPFQFLDDEQKERMSTYMQSHLDSKTTLVLITHYDNDIATWTSLRKEIKS